MHNSRQKPGDAGSNSPRAKRTKYDFTAGGKGGFLRDEK